MRQILLIFAMVSCLSGSYGQEWSRIIDLQTHLFPEEIVEAYDGGFIIAANVSTGSLMYGLVFKTDVNGNILWHKQIGDSQGRQSIDGLDLTEDGGMIVSGVTDTLNATRNPFLIKLNACGELEWCRLLRTTQLEVQNHNVVAMPDGTFFMMNHVMNSLPYPPWDSTFILLTHLDRGGNIIWEQQYCMSDSLGYPRDPHDLRLTSTDELMITGYCERMIPGIHVQYSWPLLILVDTSGQTRWELPWGYSDPDQFSIGGEGFETEQIGNTFYSVISNNNRNGSLHEPCLIKTSLDGREMSYKDIIAGAKNGEATAIVNDHDSALFIGAVYQKPWDIYRLSIFKTDTNGFVIKERALEDSIYDGPQGAILTRDRKILVVALRFMNYYVVQYWKLNTELEFDSLDNRPHRYDSLCAYPVTSSIIPSSCFMTSVTEPSIPSGKVNMIIFPNPALDKLKVALPEHYKKKSTTEHFSVTTIYHNNSVPMHLQVYDNKGLRYLNLDVEQGQQELLLNVEGWSPGLYFFQLTSAQGVVATEKVLIE